MAVNVDVRKFGAKGDGVTDDRAAIQSAIDYAAANGGGIVKIPAGTYILSPYSGGPDKPTFGIMIKSNVSVVGDGIGITNLKLQDGVSEAITGIVRTSWNGETHNVSLSRLSIDGNREGTTSTKVIGFISGVKPHNNGSSSNITIDSVEAKNCSSYGFDPHEITDVMVIKNSLAHNNGLDGFVADYLTNSVFSNNIAWDNDRHGFNITTSTPGLLLKDNIAYENASSGLIFQRGGYDIPWPEDSTVQGGAFFDNAKEGIYVRLSDGTVIRGVDSFENGTNGARFRAATDSVLENSVIRNNSQSSNGSYDDVYISEEQDSITGNTYASTNNVIQNNLVYSNALVKSRWNIREQADSSDYNLVKGNVTYGGLSGLAKTSGAHSQTIAFNKALSAGAYLLGTDVGEYLRDKSTNDTILAGGGADSVVGTGGNDVLSGGDGADTIFGGSGNDRLYGDSDSDIMKGDGGDDSIFGDDGADSLDGASGNDRLFGGAGNDTILGSGGDDTIIGLDGDDSISGGDGNDSILGGDGLNVISGGKGNDIIFGGEQADSISGDSNNDFIYSFGGADTVNGNDGNDSLGGGDGDDVVSGGTGADIISGGTGNDSLMGDSGNDTIAGDAGDDIIAGGAGADSINGGTGNDILTGSIDTDKDIFYFSATSGHDVITQYNLVNDVVQIASGMFANVEQILASLHADSSGFAILEHGLDWSVTFTGIQVSQLNSGDFLII